MSVDQGSLLHHRAVLTSGQVAILLLVSPITVARWIDRGELRGYRLPGSRDRRAHRADVIDFMLAHGMFRQVGECTVADGGILYRARLHDRWGEVVARVAPRDSDNAAGLDWTPAEPDPGRYVLKSASPEVFQMLVEARLRFQDGR